MKIEQNTLWVVALLVLSSCSAPVTLDDPPARVHLLSQEQLNSSMKVMANRLTELSFVALDSSKSSTQKSAQVIPLLESIESIAAGINGNGATTNYSVVNRYMNGFLNDVVLAKEFARREPANLVPAQRLIKSCRACHESI